VSAFASFPSDLREDLDDSLLRPGCQLGEACLSSLLAVRDEDAFVVAMVFILKCTVGPLGGVVASSKVNGEVEDKIIWVAKRVQL
jgi:hypothetical protein